MRIAGFVGVLLCILISQSIALLPRCGRAPGDSIKVPPLEQDALAANSTTLLQVQVIIRHGDRTVVGPPVCWPNDVPMMCSMTVTEVPNLDPTTDMISTSRLYRKNYLNGMEELPGNCMTGALTSIGYDQQVENGRELAEAYIEMIPLLSESLNASELYLRSDDTQRTTQSLQALLLGLYPPSEGSSATEIVNFDSIDYLLEYIFPNAAGCERMAWTMLVKEEDSLPLIFSKLSFCSAETQSAARLTSEYQAHYHSVDLPLMEKIASESSLPLDGMNLGHIADCITVHLCHNLTMPDWATEALAAEIDTIKNYEYPFVYQYPNASAGLKLTIGHFLYDIRSRLPAPLPLGLPPRKLHTDKEEAMPYPKMAIWSAHDDSLVPLLLALKSYSYWPVFASRLILETWSVNGQLAVRSIFNDEVLTPAGCSSSLCPLEEFDNLIGPVLSPQFCQAD